MFWFFFLFFAAADAVIDMSMQLRVAICDSAAKLTLQIFYIILRFITYFK